MAPASADTAAQDFAALFARTLDLFRDPTAKDEQKAQFRALAALLKSQAMIVAAENGRLVVNGTPVGGGTLLQRLEFHAVREITIPVDPPLAETFELLRLLAEQPGEEDIATRLRASGFTHIAVAIQASVIGVIEPPPPPRAPMPLHDAPAAAPALARESSEEPAIVREGMGESSAFSPAMAATRSPKELIAELLEKPGGPHAGDLLAVLGRQLETAMKHHRIAQALAIIVGIVRAEQQVTDATRRRQYSIALKRMYSKALLEAFAELANIPGDREDALLVLRRAGEDGVEVLLDLLVAAPTIEERRGIFMALTGMKEGTDQLVHMLGHHQWFVVRNVAELAGELALDDAVPALAQQLEHEDDRVRKAVALALAKIGSSAAAEPLRRALRDKSPEVRMQAALGVGGRKSSALAMPLVVAMEEEEDEGVERELMLALGRIGSAAAVQALIKFAQPGGRLFGRKPAGLRATAVEALRLAATPAAIGTLEGLTNDGDKQVRGAAQSALEDLKRK
ncbi:MAG: HEAT repeat domain-containing protein [Gemmatimonadales bacterium]